jgi:hypothetical protein
MDLHNEIISNIPIELTYDKKIINHLYKFKKHLFLKLFKKNINLFNIYNKLFYKYLEHNNSRNDILDLMINHNSDFTKYKNILYYLCKNNDYDNLNKIIQKINISIQNSTRVLVTTKAMKAIAMYKGVLDAMSVASEAMFTIRKTSTSLLLPKYFKITEVLESKSRFTMAAIVYSVPT